MGWDKAVDEDKILSIASEVKEHLQMIKSFQGYIYQDVFVDKRWIQDPPLFNLDSTESNVVKDDLVELNTSKEKHDHHSQTASGVHNSTPPPQ